MKNQTTPKVVKSNIHQTSIMNTSKSSIASNLLKKQASLNRQIEDLKNAQRSLNADIKLANDLAYQIAIREYDVSRVEQRIRDTEELIELSRKRQQQSTNIQKHSDELKKNNVRFSSLPSSSALSFEDISPQQQQIQKTETADDKNDENQNKVCFGDGLVFEIPPNHHKSEEIVRLEKYVEDLKNSIVKHEAEVVKIEEAARAKQVKNSVHMKLNMSADRKRISAVQGHHEIIDKYRSDIIKFKDLKEFRDAENQKLQEQLDKKAELDIKELEMKLEEMLFEKSNKGSIKYAQAEEKEFPMPDIEDADNDEFITKLEMRAFEEEEKLSEEETLLEKEIQEAKQALEIAKINAKANEDHVTEVISRIEESVKDSTFDAEKITEKESELNEEINKNEKELNDREDSIEKLTNKKADLLEEINDVCNERMEVSNSECSMSEKQEKEKLKLDNIDFEIAALSVQRENIRTLIQMQEIREKADKELLETLKAEYVEEEQK